MAVIYRKVKKKVKNFGIQFVIKSQILGKIIQGSVYWNTQNLLKTKHLKDLPEIWEG